MYSLLISSAVGLGVWIGGILLAWWGWIGGFFVGLVAFAITWIVMARRIAKQVQPAFERVRRQAEAGQIDAAIQTLEDLLQFGKWMPMLSGQVHAQIGGFAMHTGNKEKALLHLSRSSRRSAEGKLFLAALHHKDGNADKALEVLGAAAPYNAKHGLLQTTYAYLLNKAGKTTEAMAQLNRLLKKVPDHKIGKDNLLRLQNGQKMDLKSFGNEWFALGFERPPASMGELRTARKGFRQAPKREKPKKQPKRKKN